MSEYLGRNIPDQGASRYKGPEVGLYLPGPGNSMEATAVG